jgi:hypothetical protein
LPSFEFQGEFLLPCLAATALLRYRVLILFVIVI